MAKKKAAGAPSPKPKAAPRKEPLDIGLLGFEIIEAPIPAREQIPAMLPIHVAVAESQTTRCRVSIALAQIPGDPYDVVLEIRHTLRKNKYSLGVRSRITKTHLEVWAAEPRTRKRQEDG